MVSIEGNRLIYFTFNKEFNMPEKQKEKEEKKPLTPEKINSAGTSAFVFSMVAFGLAWLVGLWLVPLIFAIIALVQAGRGKKSEENLYKAFAIIAIPFAIITIVLSAIKLLSTIIVMLVYGLIVVIYLFAVIIVMATSGLASLAASSIVLL